MHTCAETARLYVRTVNTGTPAEMTGVGDGLRGHRLSNSLAGGERAEKCLTPCAVDPGGALNGSQGLSPDSRISYGHEPYW